MVFAEAQAIQKSSRLLPFQRGMRKQCFFLTKRSRPKEGRALTWNGKTGEKSRLGRDEYTIEMRL